MPGGADLTDAGAEGVILYWTWTTREHKQTTRRDKATKKRVTYDEMVDVDHMGAYPVAWLNFDLNYPEGHV